MTPTALTPPSTTEDKQDGLDGRERPERRLPIGAEVQPGAGVHFQIWASNCDKLDVVFEAENEADALEPLELAPERDGYFSGTAVTAADGISIATGRAAATAAPTRPRGSSPGGRMAPPRSSIPSRYAWHDHDWKGLRLEGQVFYELHLGTFSSEGTWDAAAEHLNRLLELGVTAIEVMPLAEFAGKFGWGNDRVDLFAPYHVYGKPDDIAGSSTGHKLGLGVILDVVYNHFS